MFAVANFKQSLSGLLVTLLVLYIFYADAITAFTGLGLIKLLMAVLIALGLAVYFIFLEISIIPILSFLLVIFYVIIWNGIGSINFFLTLGFGWLLSLRPRLVKSYLWILVLTQLALVSYEAATHQILYTSLTSGVLSSNEFEFGTDIFEEAGFRPKGLFPGTLLATSLIIYTSLIFRNEPRKVLVVVIMAFIVNGRLALLISSSILLLQIFRRDFAIGRFRVKFGLKVMLALISAGIGLITVFSLYSEVALANLSNVFDLKSTANMGRLLSYASAFTGFNEYNLYSKIFGKSEYIILGLYDRPTSPESELLGMLLEIGIFGLLIYLIVLVKLFDTSYIFYKDGQLGFNTVIIFTIIGMIVYRHIFGNQRGSLFWFMMLNEYRLKYK
jgi:hypothetical protein